jgi:hypothetical protein
MGMRPTSGSVAGASVVVIPLNWAATDFNVGVHIAPTSTGNGIVQMTLDNLLSPGVTPVWTTISTFSSVVSATPVISALVIPCTAIRVSNADAGGTVDYKVVQAG